MATHVLYRLFDRDGVLLYVGISRQWTTRAKRHASTKSWWRDVAAMTFEELPDREEALAAERRTIFAERPRHNREPGRPIKWRKPHWHMTATCTEFCCTSWCADPRCSRP
jgi:predicted GIY-YIG superfamily endonuclease